MQFRDLRATATTELMDAGVDIVLAQTHTGHVTVEMVRRRARRRQAQAEKAAAARQAEGAAARTKRAEKSKLPRSGV